MSKNIKEAIVKAAEVMELCAKAFKDKGRTVYSADLHSQAAGIAMRAAFHPKQGEDVEATSANYAALFHALYNHSAWRQKFEKAGIFPKATERNVESVVSELEEEVGE